MLAAQNHKEMLSDQKVWMYGFHNNQINKAIKFDITKIDVKK